MGEGAIEAHTRARDLFQATEDRHGAAQAWNNLGSAVQRAGRVEEAVRAHGVALQIYREFEDWYRTGLALRNLALAHEDAHRPAEARAHYLKAADAFAQGNAPAQATQARAQAEQLA